MNNTKTKTETPTAEWANWALINAYEEVGIDAATKASVSDLIKTRFNETVSATNHGPRTYVVMTDWGTWGRGTTLAESAAKALKAGAPRKAKAIVTLVLNDADPGIGSDGSLWSSSKSTTVYLGVVGTLGSILTANKGGAS